MSMTEAQALQLARLAAEHETDAAALAAINGPAPGVSAWITDRTISNVIGALDAAAIILELEQVADSHEHAAYRKAMAQLVNRITNSDGIDLGSPAALAMFDTMVAEAPSGSKLAEHADAIKALVPTVAGKLLGRAAMQADIDAAKQLADAKATMTAAIESARSTYESERSAILNPSE